jgi:hypothetical protein
VIVPAAAIIAVGFWMSSPFPFTQYGDGWPSSVIVVPDTEYTPLVGVADPAAVTWHAHPPAVSVHVAIAAGAPPSPFWTLMPLWTCVQVEPRRHDAGMERSSTTEEALFKEYVPPAAPIASVTPSFATKRIVPPRVSEIWNVDDGQKAANGFGTWEMQAFVSLHVPTTSPPHAVNVVQSGPLPLLPLEQPAPATLAAKTKALHEACMDESSQEKKVGALCPARQSRMGYGRARAR